MTCVASLVPCKTFLAERCRRARFLAMRKARDVPRAERRMRFARQVMGRTDVRRQGNNRGSRLIGRAVEMSQHGLARDDATPQRRWRMRVGASKRRGSCSGRDSRDCRRARCRYRSAQSPGATWRSGRPAAVLTGCCPMPGAGRLRAVLRAAGPARRVRTSSRQCRTAASCRSACKKARETATA
jgi:hypothetical protein